MNKKDRHKANPLDKCIIHWIYGLSKINILKKGGHKSMKAVKIKMRYGCLYSDNVLEIDSIYIVECSNPGFFKKEVLHDYLLEHPGTIKVNRYPYPDVVPAVSGNGEKYVRSEPNSSTRDNLLELPRE